MKRLLIIGAASVTLTVGAFFPAHAQTSLPNRGQDRAAEARANAQQRTEQIRQDAQTRGLSVREDVCERRAERMQENIPRLARSSAQLLEVMDRMYERVQEFYASGQLTVDDYEELSESVEIAQADAQTSVEVVGNFVFEFDCDSPGLGQQLEGFRQAVRGAREELKVYRTELVALISALRAEAAESTNNDEAEEVEAL